MEIVRRKASPARVNKAKHAQAALSSAASSGTEACAPAVQQPQQLSQRDHGAEHTEWLSRQPMWLRALDSWLLTPWWNAHKLPVQDGKLLVDGNSLATYFVPRRGMPLYLLSFVISFFVVSYALVVVSLPSDRVPVYTPAVVLSWRELVRTTIPALAQGESGNLLRSLLFQLAFVNLGFAFTAFVTTNRRSPFRGMHGGFRDIIFVNAAAVLFLTPLTTLPMAQELFLGGPASAVQKRAAPLLLVPHVPPALASGHGVAPHAHEHGRDAVAQHSTPAGWTDGVGSISISSIASIDSSDLASMKAGEIAAGACAVGVDGSFGGSCAAQAQVSTRNDAENAAQLPIPDGLLDSNSELSRLLSDTGDLDSVAMDAWLAEEAGVDIEAEGVSAFLQHHRLDGRTHDGRQGARLAAASRASARRAWQLQHRADAVPALIGELQAVTAAAARAASCALGFAGSCPSNSTKPGNSYCSEQEERAREAAARAWAAVKAHAQRAWSIVTLDGAIYASGLYFAGALIGFHVPYAVRAGLFTGSLSGADMARASRWQAFGMVARIGIILFFLSFHVAWADEEGVLGPRAAIYAASIAGFAWLTRRLGERYYAHLHHWFMGLALSPLARTRSAGLALMLQGLVAAQAIDGAARFSCAPLFHRHRDCADWEGYH